MIIIRTPLSETELNKVKDFLEKIKPLLATHECQFQISAKNKDFDRRLPLRDGEKIDILKSLRPEDCIKTEPNNNPRFEESEIYIFIKSIEIMVFGESESHTLYIKIYLREQTNYDTVIVISFHEAGIYD